MEFLLPKVNDSGQTEKFDVNDNAVIIIGANGSGKSKLGAWIENQNLDITYRIGAQRSLTFGKYIPQKSYEQATALLMFGSDNTTVPNHG